MLEGFRLPCVAPEPGAGTHTASILINVLAMFKLLSVEGLSIWLEAGAE